MRNYRVALLSELWNASLLEMSSHIYLTFLKYFKVALKAYAKLLKYATK